MAEPSRGSLIVVVAVLAVVAGVVAGTLWYDARWRPTGVPEGTATHTSPARESRPGPSSTPDATAADTERWALRLLQSWDSRRARAWGGSDVGALGRLYVAGSAAGRHDVAMLRSWRRRGLVVRGMRMQVLDIQVGTMTRHRLLLVVTDRLVGATAVRGTRRMALPRDAPTTRRLTFVRTSGRWRLAEAREVAASHAVAPTGR